MLHKSFDILDAKADAERGTFEATVDVFGNVDKGGDRIVPGAFKGTLAKWAESGDPIPVILSHQWDNPMAHIGVVDEAKETDKGLWVRGTLDVKDNDVARQVHRLMSRRSLKEFSFGYAVPKGGERRAKDGANELTEIELAEVGPTLKGMNPATELHAVKTALDAPDAEQLRKQAEKVAREEETARIPTLALLDESHNHEGSAKADIEHAREALLAQEQFEPDELAGMKSGLLKAVWTTAYVNDLPDSAFLYVEPGGTKDADGKTTPRSLRHFPYKDASGNVDLPHLRNALSRIPQSSLPQDVKDRCAARAQRMLDNMKSVDVTGKEAEPRPVDPLRRRADDIALEFASDGASLRKAPKPSEPSKAPEPELELADLKKRMREEILVHLSGGISP